MPACSPPSWTCSAGSSPEEGAPLLDALSEAELRVLRYLPSNLKAPEIASELYVSPNTVRTHLRHIYAKLDAHTRSEAVSRARELGLLGPTSIGALTQGCAARRVTAAARRKPSM